MKNLIIERVVKVSLYLTAEQWQFYTATNPAESSFAAAVASALNKQIAEYVNRGETREVTQRFALSLMRHNSEYGAFDSEPIAMLGQVLDEIYGEEA